MKKLEEKIIRKVYKIETRKTTAYIISRFFLGILFAGTIILLGSVLLDILKEQGTFDLVSFFTEDFEATKKYFFSNLIDFYNELPQPLVFILLVSVILLLMLILIILINFNKIRNKIKSLYKFWISDGKKYE